jgi:hypothetical protein
MINVTDKDGKYTVRMDSKDAVLRVLRHGEEWLINPPGSKAFISFACDLENARERIAELEANLVVVDIETDTLDTHDKRVAKYGAAAMTGIKAID